MLINHYLMKIQYFSDLHLEFEDNLNWIDNNAIERVGDILIIAGDLCPFVKLSHTMSNDNNTRRVITANANARNGGTTDQ